MKWYYYLHTNGDLIGKSPFVVESDSEYFNSPFVQKVWKLETDDRGDSWSFILEACALGANVDRVKELSEKWGLDKKDSFEMLRFNPQPTELKKKGMDIFIKSILKMDVDKYWDEVRDLGDASKSLE